METDDSLCQPQREQPKEEEDSRDLNISYKGRYRKHSLVIFKFFKIEPLFNKSVLEVYGHTVE